jgi:hypothetical protein
MRCITSGLIVGYESGARKIHMDRIHDAIGHIKGNVELKIHLFSNHTKLSCKQFLWVLLNCATGEDKFRLMSQVLDAKTRVVNC